MTILRSPILVFLPLLLLLSAAEGLAQCANDNSFWLDLTPTGPGNTQSTTCIWGGEYVTVTVCAGASYTFDTCASTWDTYITLYSGAGGPALAWNDDACGLQSIVNWTATFDGIIFVLVDAWPCVSNSTCGTLAVTQNSGCSSGGTTDYNMPGGTFTTCSGNFYDSGGPGNNYGNSQNITTTFCADNPGDCVAVSFSSFDLENNFDFLSIYDGPNASGILLGQYTSTNSPGVVTASNGCLTFVFTSDGSVTRPGWAATISCSPCDAGNVTFEVGCPDIDLGPDITLPECGEPCQALALTADVFETGATTSYAVQGIPFNPPYDFNTGTQFSINTDDVWSGLINLPFNFCFFGQNYTQCVVGSNGLMSFNAGYAGGICPWQFNATCPSAALPINSIYGVYHDIDPNVCGSARYAILGAAPCRVFVVNFSEVCHFSAACNNLRSTTQIVLYETTNVIEVYVQDKPTCNSWNSGNALIGIQNAAGNLGYVPPGRQTGPWTASNEAWRFTPNGVPNFEVFWYDQSSGLIGTGLTVDVCPTEPSQSYVAEAVYTRCDGTQITVEDIVTVNCLQILLPVEWLDFTAKLIRNESATECAWSTASETNNAFFTIERSSDTVQWQDIGTVTGAGNSTHTNHYTFIDEAPLDGVSYYRIRQTDYNGATDRSIIRSVERTEKPSHFAAYPNPGAGRFTLLGYQDGDLAVYDARGRRVRFSLSMNGELVLHDAAPGMYFVELSAQGEALTQRIRLMVQR